MTVPSKWGTETNVGSFPESHFAKNLLGSLFNIYPVIVPRKNAVGSADGL